MNRFLRSFGCAVSGIVFTVRTQRHMRFHIGAAAVVFLLAALLGLQAVEWAIIVGISVLVMVLEIVNTAIEKTVDLHMPTVHPLAKAAKDAAAGAVLLAAIASVIIGVIILGPPLYKLLFHVS
ncbi:diacylglycerol kinase [Paenibacillus sp. GCM10012307]|uniref:Diacylglycerol kinase family protein n=1 Tax=Paenibacillus roseus TaxID=2798579 RepID=A0A934J9W5_9BACL|nr:diacylglycerol kinase family protein [Paenibacillus roseus]MBJ6363112.1 diacylglycerol kinase family protein [Paenibacillus roseus]